MDIGRTNKRIYVLQIPPEKQNELLQTETALEEIKTVWASVEQQGAESTKRRREYDRN